MSWSTTSGRFFNFNAADHVFKGNFLFLGFADFGVADATGRFKIRSYPNIADWLAEHVVGEPGLDFKKMQGKNRRLAEEHEAG